MFGFASHVFWGAVALCVLSADLTQAVAEDTAAQREKESPSSKAPPPNKTSEDPFADVVPDAEVKTTPKERERSRLQTFFGENFGLRKEIMSQVNINPEDGAASQQSIGFEVLKKFSTETSTIASFNFQGRLVRRDGFVPVQNDMEGADRKGWALEYHNLYFDFYNVLNPVLNDEARGKNVGRFNIRAGRFYVP